MHWTAPGRCLIAWDSGQGPTWAYDPEGQPIKQKLLGECEVWRAHDPENTGNAAVRLGVTRAEAFLDTTVADGAVYVYWVMERAASGGLRQVGPTIDVEMPASWDATRDVTPPSDPQELRATRGAAGNCLPWLPSADAGSGLLAYFVYDSNQDQPDAVAWANDDVQEGTARRDSWVDRSDDGAKGYALAAIDVALNLSALVGPVVPEVVLRNLVPNPQFYFNVSDGWGSHSYLDRDDTPPVALPDSLVSSARFTPASTSVHVQAMEYQPFEAGTVACWLSCYFYRPGGYRSLIVAVFHGEESGEVIMPIYDGTDDDAGFVRRFQGIYPPPDCDQVRMDVYLYDCVAGDHRAWMTGFMIQPDPEDSDDPALYADGDSNGWEWDGERHNSASRESAP